MIIPYVLKELLFLCADVGSEHGIRRYRKFEYWNWYREGKNGIQTSLLLSIGLICMMPSKYWLQIRPPSSERHVKMPLKQAWLQLILERFKSLCVTVFLFNLSHCWLNLFKKKKKNVKKMLVDWSDCREGEFKQPLID